MTSMSFRFILVVTQMKIDLKLLGIELSADEILRHIFFQPTTTQLEGDKVELIRKLRSGTIKVITVDHQKFIQDSVVEDLTPFRIVKIRPKDLAFMRDISFYDYLDYTELAEVMDVKNQKFIDNMLSKIKRDYQISRPMFTQVLHYLNERGKFIIGDVILT